MENNENAGEVRLRFRINILLAERDMILKDLYSKVTELGAEISSSHFYRQMKPYYSPLQLDLLTYVVRALKLDPSELFDLVEVQCSPGKTKGPQKSAPRILKRCAGG